MTTDAAGVIFRHLGPEDAADLTSFRCRRYGQPWTDLVEEMVQKRLVPALSAGGTEAIGLWLGDELLGVAAWSLDSADPPECQSILVAVRYGHIGHGYGRRLKKAVIEEALNAGASVVYSYVHWDNQAMLSINAALGANIERIPGDSDHCLCVIPL